jgi:hypothetical protein
MAELIGMIIAMATFAALPGYLIGTNYGVALGICASLLGILLLSNFYLLQEIRDHVKRNSNKP